MKKTVSKAMGILLSSILAASLLALSPAIGLAGQSYDEDGTIRQTTVDGLSLVTQDQWLGEIETASVDGEEPTSAEQEICSKVIAAYNQSASEADLGDGYACSVCRDAIGLIVANPDYYWAASSFDFKYCDDDKDGELSDSDRVCKIGLYYVLGADELPQAKQAIEESIDRALGWFDSDATDFEKAQALHDYLVRTCAYDNNVAGTDAATSPSRTAYGALVKGRAVCQGYTLAYKLLLSRAGIPAIYVVSDSMNHSWNMVELDGSWYHVDATWDDPLYEDESGQAADGGFDAEVSHEFFLRSDASFTALEYHDWRAAYKTPEKDYPLRNYKEHKGKASGATVSARLSGETRYDTMEKISAAGFDSADSVILASGKNFPDALGASALAGALKAPVLLTDPGELSAQAVSEIDRLGAKRVYIVGGTAAVSAGVERALKTEGYEVARISGDSRQQTAIKIAEKVSEMNPAETAIVAAGKNAWDSLSVSPFAYAKGYPIYLANNDGSVSRETIDAIEANSSIKRIVIVGGSAAVSADAESALEVAVGDVERWSGDSRYETSQDIARHAMSEGMTEATVAVASGENFPDALAGGALVGSRGGVLLLSPAADGAQAASWISARASQIDECYILGGTSALSAEAKAQIDAALK